MSVRQLSEHIRALRARHGLTQENLAELAGMSRTYITKIENEGKNLSWRNVEKISFAFGMTPAEFFSSSEVFEIAEYEQVDDEGTVTYHTVKLEKLSPVEKREEE